MALIDRHRAPLVLLAAGLGSRYGGVKPVAPVGPDGEPLVVLAVRQALDAGFEEVVVVVGPATESAVSDALAAAGRGRAGTGGTGGTASVYGTVVLARQELAAGRARPWGTVDALLSAVDGLGPVVAGVAVANGDDLYGVDALATAQKWLGTDGRADGAAVMFEVARTMSGAGGVSRAVPVIRDGRIAAIEEQRGVHVEAGTVLTGSGVALAPDLPVSMNLWCLRPRAIAAMAELHAGFRAGHANDGSAEHGLPDAIGSLVREGFDFEVIVTSSQWFGVTWPEDVARVRTALSEPAVGASSPGHRG